MRSVQCVAIKKNGERCRRQARLGATVCNSHGGRAPQVRAKAQQRVLESHVRERVAHEGGNTEALDVLAELQRLVGQVVAMKDRLGDIVAARGSDLSTVELGLLERSLDRAARLLVAVAGLDLDARIQKINSDQVDRVLAAMRALALDLGRDPDDPDVQRATIKALRGVA